MTQSNDEPNLDDVLVPREQPHPDHRAHGKTPKHPDEDELARDVQIETEEVADDA